MVGDITASTLERIREFGSSDSNRQFPILVAGNQAASKATRACFHLGHENREMQRASIQARPVRRSAAPKSRVEQHWLPEDAQGRPAGAGDLPERQCEDSASGGTSRPPTNRASSCLAHQSSRGQPAAPKTPPRVLIPEFGQRNSLSVAGQ